jgi:hypothetical protein
LIFRPDFLRISLRIFCARGLNAWSISGRRQGVPSGVLDEHMPAPFAAQGRAYIPQA